MKTYLVTGGAGFIGSHLCERLAKDGNKVICLDNLSSGRFENINHIKGKFEFVKADVNEQKEVESIFKKNKFDGVFHYAATVGVKRTLENPIMVMNDIIGIRNILRLSNIYKARKVVFASSSEVYGEPVEIPEVESGHVNAKMPYAVVKLAGETYCDAYLKKYGLRTCSLRFFNVYGPQQECSDYGFVVGIFIKQVLKDRNPTVYGDGTQTRDFVYIDDNIEASIRAMELEAPTGPINIGTGKPTTIYDLAELIIKLCEKKDRLEPVLVPMPEGRYDIKHRFPNVSKMQKLLNFRPKYKLEEGLKKTIAWYKKNLNLKS